MPSRYSVRELAADSVYHVFNRGVEKRKIFLDVQDYKTFIYYLNEYLSPTLKTRRTNHSDLSGEVVVLAYCLLDNHFHLLLRQYTDRGMVLLMQRLMTAYTMYFNQKYKRVGSLFQGTYKAVRVDTDEQLKQVSKYIHLNPTRRANGFESYPYSSWIYYIGQKKQDWLDTGYVLALFRDADEYREFVKDVSRFNLEILPV